MVVPINRVAHLFPLLSLLLVGAACRKPSPPPPPPVPPLVVVQKVKHGFVEVGIEATGTIKGKGELELAASVPGRVVAFPVKEGAKLGRGQVVARLDCGMQKKRLSEAKAALSLARATLEKVEKGARSEQIEQQRQRIRQVKARLDQAQKLLAQKEALYQEDLASELEYLEAKTQVEALQGQMEEMDAMLTELTRGASPEEIKIQKAQVKQAEAGVALARQEVENCAVRAPQPLRLLSQLVEVGTYVQPGQPLALMADTDHLVVELALPQDHLGDVEVGMPALVSVGGVKSKIKGEVAKVDGFVKKQTRTFGVEIGLKERPAGLKPGLFATALLVQRRLEGIVVPKQALLPSKPVFFVVRDGRAVEARAKPAGETETELVLREGVEEGEAVVVQGQIGLRSGDKVHILRTLSP